MLFFSLLTAVLLAAALQPASGSDNGPRGFMPREMTAVLGAEGRGAYGPVLARVAEASAAYEAAFLDESRAIVAHLRARAALHAVARRPGAAPGDAAAAAEAELASRGDAARQRTARAQAMAALSAALAALEDATCEVMRLAADAQPAARSAGGQIHLNLAQYDAACDGLRRVVARGTRVAVALHTANARLAEMHAAFCARFLADAGAGRAAGDAAAALDEMLALRSGCARTSLRLRCSIAARIIATRHKAHVQARLAALVPPPA